LRCEQFSEVASSNHHTGSSCGESVKYLRRLSFKWCQHRIPSRRVPEYFLSFWKCRFTCVFGKTDKRKYPDLSKLACKYFHILASTGPVEWPGKVFRPDRCWLNGKWFYYSTWLWLGG